MNFRSNFFKFLIVFLSIGLVVSCSDDDDNEETACDQHTATYDGDVKEIVNSSCAYSGCHVAGFGFGNFESFDSLKTYLDDGKFEDRALTLKNMPPVDFVPDGMPTELTDEQLEILTCWKDAGYPEN